MPTAGSNSDRVSDRDQHGCRDEIDAEIWRTLSLTDSHDDSECVHRPSDRGSVVSSRSLPCDVAKTPRQRRFALGYSVLTQANAELACSTVSAEWHWDRIAAESPYYERAVQDDQSINEAGPTVRVANVLVDPFPPLVTPKSSSIASRTMSLLSMTSPPPTPPLWSRPKRLRDELDGDASFSLLSLPGPPSFTDQAVSGTTISPCESLRPPVGQDGKERLVVPHL